ncbi:hypothetical protein FDG94_gp099 [Pseudomonas phage SM1]|uniref:Uncharacterized protein n=1 Tax=Pseudomonas phage SM1 TaxID=1772332 RepID=A0A0U3CPJ8_9CAUD|nr:hypothetical protein FDG94_gp099 [Pseudomonas phage SM1]ALT58091.1 hypothetical protein SM1_099 [Pseudomonas phage SM1]
MLIFKILATQLVLAVGVWLALCINEKYVSRCCEQLKRQRLHRDCFTGETQAERDERLGLSKSLRNRERLRSILVVSEWLILYSAMLVIVIAVWGA